MPELPEVEVVRAASSATSLGATARRGRGAAPASRTPYPPARPISPAALTGRRRRGPPPRQVLWLSLDNGDALLGHLGMSGQMLVQPPGAPDERHLRVRFMLAATALGTELRFVDQRMFGGLSSPTGGAELPPEIAHIARDPLDPEFDDDAFVRRVASAVRRSSGSCSTRR